MSLKQATSCHRQTCWHVSTLPQGAILVVSRCRLQVPGVSSSSSSLSTFKVSASTSCAQKFGSHLRPQVLSSYVQFLRSSVPGQIANLIKALCLPEHTLTLSASPVFFFISAQCWQPSFEVHYCLPMVVPPFPPPSITAFVRSLWKI